MSQYINKNIVKEEPNPTKAALNFIEVTHLNLLSQNPPANTIELVSGSAIEISGTTELFMSNDGDGNLHLNHGLVADSYVIANGNVEATGGGEIKQSGHTLISVGTVVLKSSGSNVDGWLRCDGASYLTASYPALHGTIVYNYGGSGANFNVPSLNNYDTNNGYGSLAFWIKH